VGECRLEFSGSG